MLKSVVLPAPLGPTTLVIWSVLAVNVTARSATTPPNETPMLLTSSIGGLPVGRATRTEPIEKADEAVRRKDDEQEQNQTEGHQAEIRRHAQRFGQDREKDGSDHRADDGAFSPEEY